MDNKLAIISGLDKAESGLVEAKTNFERIEVRNVAKLIEAAAIITKRKDIQVQAASLIQRADRAIAKSTPPKERGRGNKIVTQDNDFSPESIRQIRHVHSKLDDDYPIGNRRVALRRLGRMGKERKRFRFL